MIDIGWVKFLFEVGAWVIASAAAVYAWIVGRGQARAAAVHHQIDTLRDDLDAVEARTGGLEYRIADLATKGDLGQLHGDMKAINASVQALQKSVDLMTDYLMRERR